MSDAEEAAKRVVLATEMMDAFGPGRIPRGKLAAWRAACDEYNESKASVIEIARALLSQTERVKELESGVRRIQSLVHNLPRSLTADDINEVCAALSQGAE